MKRHHILTIVCFFTALISPFASAWSTKEHIMLTRCAVRDLLERPDTPAAMKQWLREAQPNLGTMADEHSYLMNQRIGIYPRGVDGLAFWAVMPDMLADAANSRDKKVVPFGVPEGQLHFVDMEYLFPADTTATTKPHTAPAIADISRDMKDPRWQKAGMLPFRIEQLHKDMVKAIQAGKLVDKPGQFPRDDHACYQAGMLAHYAADNFMPMHATADYQAYSFFPEIPKEKKPKVHFDMEFRLTDDEKSDYPQLRAEFWQDFVQSLQVSGIQKMNGDVWETSLRISSAAIEGVPMIGRAGRAAYLDKSGNLQDFDADAFFHYKENVYDGEMNIVQLKAMMMAKGVRWIEALWLAAWQEANGSQP